MSTLVLVTGGFDPIHGGHIDYLEEARGLGDLLFVGLNNDEWLCRKKGYFVMTWGIRARILGALEVVHDVYSFNDTNDHALDAITILQEAYPEDRIVFANGGDRTERNIPELEAKGITFAFGIGGKKTDSSRRIISACIDNFSVL